MASPSNNKPATINLSSDAKRRRRVIEDSEEDDEETEETVGPTAKEGDVAGSDEEEGNGASKRQIRGNADDLIRLAADWKEEKEKEALLEKAGKGDAEAMWEVGLRYYQGKNGFEEDEKRPCCRECQSNSTSGRNAGLWTWCGKEFSARNYLPGHCSQRFRRCSIQAWNGFC